MTSPDLSGLIERVEAATSNDPELFWEAFAAVHGPKPERIHGGSKELDDYLAKSNPFFHILKAGAFLDAAMTLVPNDPCVGWEVSDGAGGPTARIWYVGIDRADDWEVGASPLATPALALVAASLRAQKEQANG